MSEYVKKSEVEAFLRQDSGNWTLPETIKEMVIDGLLESFGKVDAEEVVRCEDCINNDRNCGRDENWCLNFGYDVDDEDYCSYGERLGE